MTASSIDAHLLLQASAVSLTDRLIDGVAVVYNTLGTPDIGPAKFLPGSIRVPIDKTAIKALVQHDADAAAVGYMTDYADDAVALMIRLYILPGVEGDLVLAQAVDKSRDGLSVRVLIEDWRHDADGVVIIRGAQLREVSLVTLPAFPDSRVTAVTWTAQTESEQAMTESQAALPMVASVQQRPPGLAPAVAPQLPQLPAVQAPPAPAAPVEVQAATPPITAAPNVDTPPNPFVGLGASLSAQQHAEQTAYMTALAQAVAPYLAATPGGTPQAPAPSAGAQTSGPMDLQAAAHVVADWYRNSNGRGNVYELQAALSDIVPADDAGEGALRPQWLGNLWQASQTARPWINSLGAPQPLTGLRAYGWRWVLRPAVAAYAGNKADIPSNDVTTEPVTANAARMAGGWDVDRAFVDLGDPGFITALFTAAVEDYRRKTDTAVGAIIETAANVNDVAGSSFFEILSAMASAALAVGAQIDAVAVGSSVWAALAALTKDEIPWWFDASAGMALSTQDGSVGGFRFFRTADIGATAVLGWDSRGATYFEKEPPVEVQAENIPKGGVDLGVFGYYAVIVNDPRVFFNGTYVAPVEP